MASPSVPPSSDNIEITGSPKGGSYAEWVELRNIGAQPIELLGAKLLVPNAQKLVSKDGLNVFTFTASTILAPGASVRVYSLAQAGSGRLNFGTSLPLFYEQGKDVVELIAADGTAIKTVNIDAWVYSTLLPNGGNPHVYKARVEGSAALQATFTIENCSTQPLVLTGNPPVTLTSGAGSFVISSQPTSPLAPHAKSEFIVSYDGPVGEQSGSLSIPVQGQSMPIVVSLQATTTAKVNVEPAFLLTTEKVADAAGLSATSFDFGEVAGGSSKSVTFVIENSGSGTLVLTGNPVIGLEGSAFTLTQPPGKTSLGPGEKTTFTLSFVPSVHGDATGTLSIPNNVANATRSLKGKQVGPVLEVSRDQAILAGTPLALGLGACAAGAKASTVTISLRNTGDRDLTLSTPLALGGADAGSFTIVSSPSSPLAAGASTSFVVQFTPAANASAGPMQATLMLTSDDPQRKSIEFDLAGEVSVSVAPPTSPIASVGLRFAADDGVAYIVDAEGRLGSWTAFSTKPPPPDVLPFTDTGVRDVLQVAMAESYGVWLLERNGKVYQYQPKSGVAAQPVAEGVVQIGSIARHFVKLQGDTLAQWIFKFDLWWLGADKRLRSMSAMTYENVATFSCGLEHMLVLHTDGTVSHSSANNQITDAIAVSASTGHYSETSNPSAGKWDSAFGAVLTKSGAVWVWPDNNSLTPVLVPVPAGVKLVSLVEGGRWPAAVDEQGTIWNLRPNQAPARWDGTPNIVRRFEGRLFSNITWVLDSQGNAYYKGPVNFVLHLPQTYDYRCIPFYK